MSHRQFVKDTLRDNLDLNLEGLTGVELGAGRDVEMKEFFETEFSVKEWLTTDLHGSHSQPMENLDLPDKSYDIVFSCHAFEHCERPIDALKEMKRVARKYVIIATPYHCKKHILDADEDHIFCLTEYQMRRLFKYVKIKEHKIYTDTKQDQQQNWNLISIGKVK